MKIIVLAHGHPEISRGGAENAAFAHFRALQAAGHDCLFVALASPELIGHDGHFGVFRGEGDQVLWIGAEFDSFRLTARTFTRAVEDLDNLITRFEADVVHFHHYFGIGIDVIAHIKTSGRARVFLTLHEYGGICDHFGQMVKTAGRGLCHAASPAECHACFPQVPSGHFFLRQQGVLRALNALDGLISPSRFLAARYLDFGIDPGRMHVIENLIGGNYVQPAAPPAATPADGYSAERPLRLGYFGQFTPFKGLDVAVRAAGLLSKKERKRVTLSLYGVANGEMNRAFYAGLEPLIEAAWPAVMPVGGYRSQDVIGLMRELDWVIMPSTWWENAPVVLQEARIAGVPVLASGIGGMAEMVTPGVNGAHFVAGSPASLAQRIRQILNGELIVRPEPFDVEAFNADRRRQLLRLYSV